MSRWLSLKAARALLLSMSDVEKTFGYAAVKRRRRSSWESVVDTAVDYYKLRPFHRLSNVVCKDAHTRHIRKWRMQYVDD